MPQPTRFTHTRLLVADMDSTYRFYRDVLGFKPRFDAEGSVYAEFAMGDHTLALFSRKLMNHETNPGAADDRGGAGDSVVICLAVASVDQEYERLLAAGVRFINQPHDQLQWELRVCHFRDPDGNLLELNGPLSRR